MTNSGFAPTAGERCFAATTTADVRPAGCRRFIGSASGALFLAGLLAADAAEPAPDKSVYNLFNPTPRELMRDMITDRPDQTESSYTVDAGHIQFEVDFFNYTHDRDDGVITESLVAPSINFKVGLLNNMDVQFVLDAYVHERINEPGPGPAQTAQGIGDFQTRLKLNLWGNDGGVTALAMMPFVKWPTAHSSVGNGAYEGGVIFPFSINTSDRFGFVVMTEFDILQNEANDNYHGDFINSVTFGGDITEHIGGYVEFFTVVSTEQDSEWQGQFDFGITYSFNEGARLDLGVNIGLTDSAPDWQPFFGGSFRF